MSDVQRLFQALVAPAIFVSATGLLLLSLNVRLMGMVSRLRQFHREQHRAVMEGHASEAESYESQIVSVERRAELIRKSFVFMLISLEGTIAACLLLGLSLYREWAGQLASAVIVCALLSLLLATTYYLREVTVALSSVRDEAADLRFMDLDLHAGTRRAGTRD